MMLYVIQKPAISNSDLAVIDEVDGEACNPSKAQEVEDNPDESQYTTPQPGRRQSANHAMPYGFVHHICSNAR
jgi:hypothetical protein